MFDVKCYLNTILYHRYGLCIYATRSVALGVQRYYKTPAYWPYTGPTLTLLPCIKS